jgi:hypothetical protein
VAAEAVEAVVPGEAGVVLQEAVVQDEDGEPFKFIVQTEVTSTDRNK